MNFHDLRTASLASACTGTTRRPAVPCRPQERQSVVLGSGWTTGLCGARLTGAPGAARSYLQCLHVDALGLLISVTHGPARRMSHPEPTRSVLISNFGQRWRKESPRVSRTESMWIRNLEESETLEDDFGAAIADGVLTQREIANLRLGLRRNTSRHDENASVIPLACAYLNGGESARGNYHSQIQKRERVNRSAGYRTLADAEVSSKQTAS